MRLPSFTALRAFEAAARTGSFSAAGRELNVTHAAVAQQVRALEAELGVPLAFREGRGLALTGEGQRLAQALTDSFKTIGTALSEITDEGEERPLRLTITPSFASKWLMPRLGKFWRQHPDIALTLDPDDRIRDLNRDGYDLAIRYGKGGWPGAEAEMFLPTEDVVVAAPSLAGWPEQMAWLRSLGLDPDRLDVTEMPTEELANLAAREGLGLFVELSALAAADLKAGRLRTVYTPPKEGNFGYWIVTRPGPKNAALKTFVRWLKSEA
ncbi:MAG: LysR family transcriptional regulator [Rhodobacteraceae bacterium]|nr:LysR family transcriptional regulator [Paracoccaceae bacterium]